jgi:hypothetical protein
MKRDERTNDRTNERTKRRRRLYDTTTKHAPRRDDDDVKPFHFFEVPSSLFRNAPEPSTFLTSGSHDDASFNTSTHRFGDVFLPKPPVPKPKKPNEFAQTPNFASGDCEIVAPRLTR